MGFGELGDEAARVDLESGEETVRGGRGDAVEGSEGDLEGVDEFGGSEIWKRGEIRTSTGLWSGRRWPRRCMVKEEECRN